MRSARNVSTISQVKLDWRNDVILPPFHFRLKPEVSADSSSCCFCSNDTTGNITDHQSFLSLIWHNLPHHGLGWLELNTLFSKDILANMFSRIPCKMAIVNGDENALPKNLDSGSSESNTETPKKGSLILCVILFERKEQDEGSVSRYLWFYVKRRDSVLDRLTICIKWNYVIQNEQLTWNLNFYSASERKLRRRLAKSGLYRTKM